MANEAYAREITNITSGLKGLTPDNTVNPYTRTWNLEVVGTPWMHSDDCWFVTSDKFQYFYSPPKFSFEMYKTQNLAVQHSVVAQFACWTESYYGVVGYYV